METLLSCCCGLDVHNEVIQGCILKGTGTEPEAVLQTFGATRDELIRLYDWLISNECYTLAMESTGVYWCPIYDLLEDAGGIDMLVVNAHHMRNLPGHKTDVADAQWIATLLRHGLLHNSYVPTKYIRSARNISRLKRKLTYERVACINRLEKFLQSNGFKLSTVVSDITGVSARKLLDILAKRGRIAHSDVLLSTHGRIKASHDEIELALRGRLDPVDCALLKFLLSKLDTLQSEIDALMQILLDLMKSNQYQIEQLDSLPGIDQNAALTILAEIGPDPHNHFSSSGKLCSWAGLTPRNDQSAGKTKSRKTLPGNPYVKGILVQCAWAAVRSRKSPIHDWFWKRQSRIGKKKAIIALGKKDARAYLQAPRIRRVL